MLIRTVHTPWRWPQRWSGSYSLLEGTEERRIVIVAEKRGKREDKNLFVAFERIVTTGTSNVSRPRFGQVTIDLKFVSKAANAVGTQLADLAAYPIARYVLDRSAPNPAFEVVKTKFYGGLASGLKIVPEAQSVQ